MNLLRVAPLGLGGGELGARASRLDVAGVDDLLQPGEDGLDRIERPAVGLEILQRQPDLVAALLDRRSDGHRLVVGRRLLAPAEQELALALGVGAEGQHLVVRLRHRPAVLLEQRRRVPQRVHREHVVQQNELAVERAWLGHAGVQRVLDHRALVVLRLDDSLSSSSWSRIVLMPIRPAPRVVDDVRRVAGNETGLQGLGDLGRRCHLDRRSGLLLLHLLGGELGVVDAVAAVEDDGVNGRVGRHAEGIGVADLSAGRRAGAWGAGPSRTWRTPRATAGRRSGPRAEGAAEKVASLQAAGR